MPAPFPHRIYVAAVPGEMDGERAILEGLVLPELRKRLHGEGAEIVVVDPAKATGEAWDLAFRFQEIEGCQIFLGLLGERYGATPKAIPPPLSAAQPWLAEEPGRSVLEIEVLHGALRRPERRASFFYFRNPRFPSMVPEELRGRFLPENDEAMTRLEALKERIRSSGRPVFDGYPCGWSEGLDRAARLDTFAEQVFQDLWEAIQEPSSPPSFDPNATMLAFSSAPRPLPEKSPEIQGDETRMLAAAPRPSAPISSQPISAAPISSTSIPSPPVLAAEPAPPRRSRGLVAGVAAAVALAVLGLGLYAVSRQTATPPAPVPASPEVRTSPPVQSHPVIDPETWARLAAACRIGTDSAKAIRTRAPAGSPMVQVFASTDGSDAGQALARYSSRRGMLLPLEENGHAVCTVVLGPFKTQEAASRTAAEIRMSEGTDAKVVQYPGFTE